MVSTLLLEPMECLKFVIKQDGPIRLTKHKVDQLRNSFGLPTVLSVLGHVGTGMLFLVRLLTNKSHITIGKLI